MRPKYLILFLLLFTVKAYSQTAILDYKTKTAANAKDRTEMLDALRAHLHKDLKITLEFVVDHLKAAGNYAWFQGSANRKDGKQMKFEDEDARDCCHVEALFQKKAGKWTVAEGAAFSTDVWYEAIAKRYPAVPKGIWPKDSPALLAQ
jgi:hypothetical protein